MIIADGMADYPLEELGGKTPLEAARTPYADELCSQGITGTIKAIPKNMEPASDVAIMSLLGYDPQKYYSGRGPLEAASQDISLKENDIALRCNLVTIDSGIMADYSAGHIDNKEALAIINVLNKKLGNEYTKFYPGLSYRHLTIISSANKNLFSKTKCTPPHDITGKPIQSYLPTGPGSEILRELMEKSFEILKNHEINEIRVNLGENPANMIWLWGQGKNPNLEIFKNKYGIEGAIISAVDVVKGLAKCVKLEVIDVPGATGYFDTDYSAKANYALAALNKNDLVVIHVEATDEAGHEGNTRAKIQAIENIDNKIIKTVKEGLIDWGKYRIIFLADHPTPIELKTHTSTPVPFIVSGVGINPDNIFKFNEKTAKTGSLHFSKGYKLMDWFVKTKY
jgi:2,3-bisphosphoglycerate-independent phosphoglycerate mutase